MRLVNQSQARRLAIGVAAVRVAFGAGSLVAPSFARLWVGPDGAGPAGKLLCRSLGARELALGAGTIAAGMDGARLRRWAVASAIGDMTDAVGTWAGASVPKRSRVPVLAISLGAAFAGLAAASALGPGPQPGGA